MPRPAPKSETTHQATTTNSAAKDKDKQRNHLIDLIVFLWFVCDCLSVCPSRLSTDRALSPHGASMWGTTRGKRDWHCAACG